MKHTQHQSLHHPGYILDLALADIDSSSQILAIAQSRNTIDIFTTSPHHDEKTKFRLAARLSGHEGWVHALDFTRENEDGSGDLFLATASQDKYIRLWRIREGILPVEIVNELLVDPAVGFFHSLSNKIHRIDTGVGAYSLTFEALLLGHEDRINTARWRHRQGKLQLLTTSEDNSLAIWEPEPDSLLWICATRLGEISAQKGSTTATGSAGGFWTGHWSPDGDTVVCLGRTGSWRKWSFDKGKDVWEQGVAISGHVREVRGLAWARDGSYLLSTSSDQTTRLWAQWHRDASTSTTSTTNSTKLETRSWHEYSRPQIHGYDLNCISVINNTQFISGADEKLLRVFDEPRSLADILATQCRITSSAPSSLPDAANIPVLGLSNKAIQSVTSSTIPTDDVNSEDAAEEMLDPANVIKADVLNIAHPPFEDHLSRYLLWPEVEKLYGHGFEISAVASNSSGTLIATACKATSIDHAVIRLYDTRSWLEIKPPLKAHTLTIYGLSFSYDDEFLVSVGRDRQVVVWKRKEDGDEGDGGKGEGGGYEVFLSDPKGHSRMILGCSFLQSRSTRGTYMFATAGRDKCVKIWEFHGASTGIRCPWTLPAGAPVTAVAFAGGYNGNLMLAFGTETGKLSIVVLDPEVEVQEVEEEVCPGREVSALAWRPGSEGMYEERVLAVGSLDGSLRLLWVEKLVRRFRSYGG